ncbi:DUF445 domain-containing protein [Streptomyces sp. NPDC059070]|uniref:DUF445 domain-containing protein n=1 Tax=Streptomyces sp. NPDC059070 TaxID=3346713 RepID=UPI0036B019AB
MPGASGGAGAFGAAGGSEAAGASAGAGTSGLPGGSGVPGRPEAAGGTGASGAPGASGVPGGAGAADVSGAAATSGVPGGTETAGRSEAAGPTGPSGGAGAAAGAARGGSAGGGPSAPPLPPFSYTEADEEKRRGVRRMKATATGLLLFVALVFALATWADRSGAGPWAAYVAAAAEAGMVGALADWFAVTALFRHPLGVPIPHTAIIPNKKDQLGESLGQFVGENFLSPEVVRTRLGALGIGGRVGVWLADPAHADRVTSELATALRGALTVLRDSDVQAVVGEAITRRADAAEIAPGMGKTLEKVVADGGHRRVVDLVCARAHDWLVLHGDSVMDAVQGGAPGWTPRFVDRKVGERVYKELLRFVTEMRDMPSHPARGALDRFLADFAADLQSDTETRAKVERLKSEVLARPEIQDVIASAWSSVRTMIIAAAEDERSELRLRARASLLSLGNRLATDARLQSKVDGWLQDAAAYVVSTYRAEITSLITDTVRSWDATDTSRKIEAHIGRDLQFIRINGTVVGALAGLVIFAVARGFGG